MPASKRADNKKQISGYFLDTLATEFDNWEAHGFTSRTAMMEFCFLLGLKKLHAEKVESGQPARTIRATKATRVVMIPPGRRRQEWVWIEGAPLPVEGDVVPTKQSGLLRVSSRNFMVNERDGHLDEIQIVLEKLT